MKTWMWIWKLLERVMRTNERIEPTRLCRVGFFIMQNTKGLLHTICSQLIGTRFKVDQFAMQRSVADSIEGMMTQYVIDNIESFDYTAKKAKSKRSIEDVLVAKDGMKFFVDVKSKHIGAAFSMPNLISIGRLTKLYADANKYLLYVFVYYQHKETTVDIQQVEVVPIEFMDWKDLCIANLGTGQLQIKNANNPIGKYEGDRQSWIDNLNKNYMIFCEQLIQKITKRISCIKT